MFTILKLIDIKNKNSFRFAVIIFVAIHIKNIKMFKWAQRFSVVKTWLQNFFKINTQGDFRVKIPFIELIEDDILVWAWFGLQNLLIKKQIIKV